MDSIKAWLIDVLVKKGGPSAIRGAILGIIGFLVAKSALLTPYGVSTIGHKTTIDWDVLGAYLPVLLPALTAAIIKILGYHGQQIVTGDSVPAPAKANLLVIGLLASSILLWPERPAFADNPTLSAICSSVDCLNNFTPKGGYSFQKKKLMGGGFTDFKQDWFVSPAIGFDAAKGEAPNVDVNVVLKLGPLLTAKVPYIHDFVNSHPMTQGLMKYTTIGVTGAPDFANGSWNTWYDMEWVGVNIPLP